METLCYGSSLEAPHHRDISNNNPIYLMYSDRQDWANSADPDEMQQNAASHQGLHFLPFIQQFFDITLGSKLYLFEFKNQYGKGLRCPNTWAFFFFDLGFTALSRIFHLYRADRSSK